MGLTVACVLRSGGDYDAEYVERLAAGVAAHLPVPHRFVCLSDLDVPCERIPLEHGWPGWWSKIEAFRLPGPVLYLDLDTIVTGDLTDIAAPAPALTMLRDLYGNDRVGSGVMAWGDGQTAHLYDRFAADSEGWMTRIGPKGDQGFIEAVTQRAAIRLWQDVVPGQIVSYKVHVRMPVKTHHEIGNGTVPAGARLVCFHGRPRPRDIGWRL